MHVSVMMALSKDRWKDGSELRGFRPIMYEAMLR